MFICYTATAPISPFVSSISKQRGYSAVIVGLICTALPLPGIFLRPIVGGITDRYKCRKLVIVVNAIVLSIFSCALLFTPGMTGPEMQDSDVIKLPLFWFYTCTVVLLYTGGSVRTVLEDTICIGLLGNTIVKYFTKNLNVSNFKTMFVSLSDYYLRRFLPYTSKIYRF